VPLLVFNLIFPSDIRLFCKSDVLKNSVRVVTWALWAKAATVAAARVRVEVA
jgi:hypothetical protein